MALMILVNTGGDSAHTFGFLQHSRWNGCTLADAVFPCFHFMAGISAAFSIAGQHGCGVYHQGFYDPEGALSTLPAIATTLIGLLAGMMMRTAIPLASKQHGLLVASVACLGIGMLWNIWLPMNKRLWTSTFVLWTADASLLALWFLSRLLDESMDRLSNTAPPAPRWSAPAMVFGANALTAYLGSELLASLLGSVHLSSGVTLKQAVYHPLAALIPSPYMASLSYSLLFTYACYVPMRILYVHRIFIKI